MAFLNTTTFPSPVPQEVSQAEIAFCDGLTENVQAAITAERARVQTVALGGTNATTAGGALTNLGAASAADLANRGRPVEFGGDFATWTATSTPPCTSLVDGMIIYGICYRQSDVGVTINLDGLGAKNSVSALGMSNHYWGAILAGEFCVWQWSATMNTWILLAPLRLKSTDVPSILGATQFNGLVACPQGISGAAGYNKTALGTNQATALSLGTSINSAYFGTVAAGTGAKLPATGSTSTPIMITIFNGGANALLLYPATGESIIDPLGTNLGANNPYSIPAGKAYVAMPGYADTVGIWMLTGSIPSRLGPNVSMGSSTISDDGTTFKIANNSGAGAGAQIFLEVGGHTLLALSSYAAATFENGIAVPTDPPASASATGVAGKITWDANYVYVCVAANTWKRAAIATW